MATKPTSKGTKREVIKFTTPVFRLSFPNLFEARRSDQDNPESPLKFGCSAIWTPAKFTDREKVLWKKIIGALDAEAQKAFGKPWKNLPENIKRGLRNGNSKEGLDGYGEGTRFANLTTKNPVGVIDKDGNDISKEEGNTDEIYPGCYCRATVNVYSFTKKGKGVAIGLRAIQKIKDGPRLDSRVAAADDFDEEVDAAWLEQEDDADDGAEADDENDF